MPPISEIQKPHDDPYSLIGENWPSESELAYTTAECAADDSATTATIQAESADDAVSKMPDEHGKTADSVSGTYGRTAALLREQAITFTTISAWMVDAAGKIRTAKKQIAVLVRAGTSEIRVALDSELRGTPGTPSSVELSDKYRDDIASVVNKLTTDLDAIGHSLTGTPGASRTPSYTSIPTSPTAEHPSPTVEVAAYNTGQAPEVAPHELPPMPRAVNSSSAESTSTPGTPAPSAAPHSVNPTLAGLVTGSGPSASSMPPSTSSSHGSASGTTPAGKAAQPPEHRQDAKSAGLPHIPSIALPDLLPAAAESIATGVSAASGSQLPTASTAPSTPGSSIPASTGLTPGMSGTPPVTPAPPVGLAPVGGGLPTAPVTQATPAVQGTPATPSPAAPAPSPQSPAPTAPRGPVADIAWLQQRYGLAPGLGFPKGENPITPAPFIAGLPEHEAHLHRALATLRHAFDDAGWSQPTAVATIRKGLEARTVYATSDAISIWPTSISLPAGVTPLDEIAGVPTMASLSGSLMVSEKLVSMIPRGWEVEAMMSTVPGGESNQTAEQFHELVEAGELLECTVSRGDSTVEIDEALSVFARAAIGSRGCSDLDTESARLRASRWVGVQPVGYLDGLSRWHLSDAADSMSTGNWREAVWACEKYMDTSGTRSQAA